MNSLNNFEVIIVGAGVSGLCLALSLPRYNIECSIYEKMGEGRTGLNGLARGGAITLFSNSLRILDMLGVYSTIHKEGFDLTTTVVRDASFKAITSVQISKPEKYGYSALRIMRDSLINALVAEARKQGVSIDYEHKLVGIVEHDAVVTGRFSNGAEKTASLVVGADGLRSKVRQISFPNAPVPSYTGQIGIMWSVIRSKLKYPPGTVSASLGADDFEATTMMTPQGVVLFVLDSADGADKTIGIQRAFPERDFIGWKKLGQDKAALARVLYEVEGQTPEPVKSAIEYTEKSDTNEFFLWPFYVLSTVDGWVSTGGKGRVVLIGDAAHAFPPTGGQGANMAIEDADGLGVALGIEKQLEYPGQTSSLVEIEDG